MTANLSVGVTDVHPLATSPALGSYTECGQYEPGDGTLGPTVSIACTATARYVIVQLQTTAVMSLCEVEVYSTRGIERYRLVVVVRPLSRI